jgi:uncharacterized protein (DUF302 family)
VTVSTTIEFALAAALGLFLPLSSFTQAAAKDGGKQMTTRQVSVQRVSVISAHPFNDVVAKIESAVGHPDMKAFGSALAAAKTQADMEKVIQAAVGPSGLMEFARYDLGAVLRKEPALGSAQIVRLVVGNPLIMEQMVKHVPDAGSYAPVTILIDERRDGVHLSYDKMASFLAPYGSSEALKIARDLDSKVESLLVAAAN